MKEPNAFIPTRQSLLSRLRSRNDEDDWTLFFNTYWRLIYNAAVRAGLSDAEAHDVVQETLLSVFKSIPEFHYQSGKGSFKNWLMRLTGWRIADQLRSRDSGRVRSRPPTAGSTDTSTLERIADPGEPELESLWDLEWKENLMSRALEAVKGKVDPRDYQIYHLYAMKHWPVSKVAEALKVNPAKIYLVKFRINHVLKRAIARLKKRPI